MPKRRTQPKDIVARSIILKDSKGKTRIYMDAGSNPDNAVICLFGKNDRSIQLIADQEGGLQITFHDSTCKISAGLGILSDDRVALFLNDHRSGTRTELGSTSAGEPHHLTLHHHGKVHWTTKKPKRRTK